MDVHADLFQALTEFYTIFVQLAVVPSSFLRFPDPDVDIFNAEAALEAGFSPEVVALLPQLPYLDVDNGEGALQIMPSTDPVNYMGESCDVGTFEWFRDMDDDPNDDDYKIPGHSFRLSTQNIYGLTLIYNTQTRLMIPWYSFQNDPDVLGYEQIQGKPPTEVLGPWIERYRKLEILRWPGHVDFDPEADPIGYDRVKDKEEWEAADKRRQARLKLRHMYLECGWDVNSKTQEAFDQERFVAMRDQLIEEEALD